MTAEIVSFAERQRRPVIDKIVCARLHGVPDPPWPIIPLGYGWFGCMWILPEECGEGQLVSYLSRLDPGARLDYRMRRLAFGITEAALSSGLWKWRE